MAVFEFDGQTWRVVGPTGHVNAIDTERNPTNVDVLVMPVRECQTCHGESGARDVGAVCPECDK